MLSKELIIYMTLALFLHTLLLLLSFVPSSTSHVNVLRGEHVQTGTPPLVLRALEERNKLSASTQTSRRLP